MGWLLKHNGVTKSPAQWGLSRMRLNYVTQAADTLNFVHPFLTVSRGRGGIWPIWYFSSGGKVSTAWVGNTSISRAHVYFSA